MKARIGRLHTESVTLPPNLPPPAAALYGLLRRTLWGRETATLAAIALMFTVVGIPFGYLTLKQMWPARLAEASLAPA